MPPFRLDLPDRPSKPRSIGLTHVLDKGMPAAQAADALCSCGDYVDVWKFGWGTAYLDPDLSAKLGLLGDRDILGCLGGTLLEVAWAQSQADDLLAWAADAGFPCIEVSRGATEMSRDGKCDLIHRVAQQFTVVSEVGRKSAAAQLPAAAWAHEVSADLAAGARWVLAEGRESGTVGIYDESGDVRDDIVDAVVDAGGDERIVFEAPNKDQQAWFIRRFGTNVNLANIAVGDVLGLETLRLGLRADTIDLSCPAPIRWP